MSRGASDHASLPEQFGPYRVEREIGAGALGPVLQARESKLDRVVAVKAFTAAANERGTAALGRALSAVTVCGLAHPSIVQPLAAGVEAGVPYLASELVVGDSLDVALGRYGPAPAADTSRLVAQIAAALDAARGVGLVHGRLNPRDLLVTPELVRVTGAGVAAALESCGFPSASASAYSAPERVANRAWDHRADIFSMAAIAWELLTGRRLPPSGTPLTTEAGDVEVARPEKLREVLARALNEDPGRRFESARDFASALEVALTGRVSRVTPPAVEIAAATESAIERPVRRKPARGARERLVPPVSPHHDDAPAPAHVETSRAAPPADHPGDAPASAAEPPDERLRAALAPTPDAIRFDLNSAAADAGTAPAPEATEDGGGGDSREEPGAPQTQAQEPSATDPLDLPLVIESEAAPADLPFEPPGEPVEPAPPVIVRPVQTPTSVDDGAVRRRASDPVPVFLQNKPSGRANTPDPSALGELYGSTKPTRSSGAWLATLVGFGILVGFAAGYWTGTRLTTPGESVAPEVARHASPAPSDGVPGAAMRGQADPRASGAPGTASLPVSGKPGGAVGAPAATPRADSGGRAGGPASPIGTEAPAAVALAPPPGPQAQAARSAPSTPAPLTSAPATPARRSAGGRLTVRSTPPGATVLVNGEARGRTPVTLSALPFRAFTVRLTLPGYQSSQRQVSLSAARPSGAIRVTLRREPASAPRESEAPATPVAPVGPSPSSARASGAAAGRGTTPAFHGALSIDSTPSGAQIFLDKAPVGITPLVLERVAVGSHVVRAERSGFRGASRAVQVVAGGRASVSFVLEPERVR